MHFILQELTAKARQLELTTEELQSLQTDHVSLQSKLSYVEQQLHTTSSSLGEAEDSRHRSEAQVLLLQDKLTHADGQQQRLAREVRLRTTVVLACGSTALLHLEPTRGPLLSKWPTSFQQCCVAAAEWWKV